jgi:hypothetical protein
VQTNEVNFVQTNQEAKKTPAVAAKAATAGFFLAILLL